MALPRLLLATAIPVAPRPESAGVESVDEKVLDTLQVPTQDQRNWCWAAVALGLCTYKDAGFDKSQCQVASDILGLDACANPTSDEANVTQPIDHVLKHFKCLAEPSLDEPMEFDDIVKEIDADHPVCIRIRFTEFGHVAVIRGYRREGRILFIDDPAREDLTMSYEEAEQYEGDGAWKQTYRIR